MGLFKEFMHVIESRTSSSFCTSTRINCSKKQLQEFCYITWENKRSLHEFSKLYEGNDFTGTVLEVLVDLRSNRKKEEILPLRGDHVAAQRDGSASRLVALSSRALSAVSCCR